MQPSQNLYDLRMQINYAGIECGLLTFSLDCLIEFLLGFY